MALSDRDIIAELGGHEAVAAALRYSEHRVKKWMQRGISWPERDAVAELAGKRGVNLPSDFLRKRRMPAKKRKAA